MTIAGKTAVFRGHNTWFVVGLVLHKVKDGVPESDTVKNTGKTRYNSESEAKKDERQQ